MKKFLMLICAMTLALGMFSNAQADLYYVGYADDVWFSSSTYTTYTWTFDLDASTSMSAEDTIDSAFFNIKFYDKWDWFEKEYGSLAVDGSDWYVSEEIGGSDSIYFASVTGALADHVLSVTVDWISGDFGVDWTALFGHYTDNPGDPGAPVPEPATILLMGIGLLGLIGYSRKRFSKKS